MWVRLEQRHGPLMREARLPRQSLQGQLQQPCRPQSGRVVEDAVHDACGGPQQAGLRLPIARALVARGCGDQAGKQQPPAGVQVLQGVVARRQGAGVQQPCIGQRTARILCGLLITPMHQVRMHLCIGAVEQREEHVQTAPLCTVRPGEAGELQCLAGVLQAPSPQGSKRGVQRATGHVGGQRLVRMRSVKDVDALCSAGVRRLQARGVVGQCGCNVQCIQVAQGRQMRCNPVLTTKYHHQPRTPYAYRRCRAALSGSSCSSRCLSCARASPLTDARPSTHTACTAVMRGLSRTSPNECCYTDEQSQRQGRMDTGRCHDALPVALDEGDVGGGQHARQPPLFHSADLPGMGCSLCMLPAQGMCMGGGHQDAGAGRVGRQRLVAQRTGFVGGVAVVVKAEQHDLAGRGTLLAGVRDGHPCEQSAGCGVPCCSGAFEQGAGGLVGTGEPVHGGHEEQGGWWGGGEGCLEGVAGGVYGVGGSGGGVEDEGACCEAGYGVVLQGPQRQHGFGVLVLLDARQGPQELQLLLMMRHHRDVYKRWLHDRLPDRGAGYAMHRQLQWQPNGDIPRVSVHMPSNADLPSALHANDGARKSTAGRFWCVRVLLHRFDVLCAKRARRVFLGSTPATHRGAWQAHQ